MIEDGWPVHDLLAGRLDGVDKRLESLERSVVWGFGITWTLIIATGVLTRLVHG